MREKKTLLVLFMLLLTQVVFAQYKITGIVSDESGNPIENVLVRTVCLTDTVKTNKLGEYLIEIIENCDTLIFTYKQTQVQELVKERKVVNLSFSCNSTSLRNERAIVESDRLRRFGLLLNIGGPTTYLALGASFFFTKNINIEAGVSIGSVYGGANYYFSSVKYKQKWRPYFGLHYVFQEEFMADSYTFYYVPVGINFINQRGASLSFELAGQIGKTGGFFPTPIWGGIRLVKYF